MISARRKVFGDVTGTVHTIEYQKRGLPHAHILLMIRAPFRPKTVEDVDSVVSAEIPDPVANPELYEVAIDCMLHELCGTGSPCWKDGASTQNFPKEFREETSVAQDCYPKYRRHEQWRTASKTVKGRQVTFDNSDVIPYHRGLSRK
jgi:hypothetical protein